MFCVGSYPWRSYALQSQEWVGWVSTMPAETPADAEGAAYADEFTEPLPEGLDAEALSMLDIQHSFSAWDLPKLERFGQLHTFGEGKHMGKTWLQAVTDDRGFAPFIDKVVQDTTGTIWWDFIPWSKAWIRASPEPAPKELPTTIPDIDTMTIAEPAPGELPTTIPDIDTMTFAELDSHGSALKVFGGRHRGQTFTQVASEETEYSEWLLKVADIPQHKYIALGFARWYRLWKAKKPTAAGPLDANSKDWFFPIFV